MEEFESEFATRTPLPVSEVYAKLRDHLIDTTEYGHAIDMSNGKRLPFSELKAYHDYLHQLAPEPETQ